MTSFKTGSRAITKKNEGVFGSLKSLVASYLQDNSGDLELAQEFVESAAFAAFDPGDFAYSPAFDHIRTHNINMTQTYGYQVVTGPKTLSQLFLLAAGDPNFFPNTPAIVTRATTSDTRLPMVGNNVVNHICGSEQATLGWMFDISTVAKNEGGQSSFTIAEAGFGSTNKWSGVLTTPFNTGSIFVPHLRSLYSADANWTLTPGASVLSNPLTIDRTKRESMLKENSFFIISTENASVRAFPVPAFNAPSLAAYAVVSFMASEARQAQYGSLPADFLPKLTRNITLNMFDSIRADANVTPSI